MEENNEKYLLLFKSIVVGIAYCIIGICALFFILVSKVNAVSTTYDLNSVSIGNDTSGTSANAPKNTWFNYGPNLNYINGYFTGHNGSFNAHILIELNYGEVVNPNSNAQIVILAYLDNNLLSGSSGNCPKVGTGKYNCDLYVSGSNDSNTNVLALQLKTIGTYYTNHVISVRVSGSVTYDDSTANLNNGSFNQGISSINSNISGASSEIIGNQNQNTQDIINNQNSNSQAQIDAIEKQNLKCENKSINFVRTKINYYLTSNGSEFSNNNYDISNYIEIDNNKNYTITNIAGNSVSFCLYQTNSNVNPSCTEYSNRTSITFNSGNYNYIRVSMPKLLTTNISGEYCYNMLDKQNQTQQQQFDYMQDTNIDSSSMSGFDVDFDYGGITNVITAPLQAINSLLNNTCSNLVIPLPFVSNKNLTLPCLTPIYQQHFNAILLLYQTIITGIVAYWICLNIFHMVHGFSDPTEDKIEVVDL